MDRFDSLLFRASLKWLGVTCALIAALIGCARTPPADPYAQIVACDRPEEIHLDKFREFEISFDAVDPRIATPKVALGATVHVVGRFTPLPGTTAPGDDLSPIVGYRRVSGATADWSVPPCRMGVRCEWGLSCRQRGTPTVEIDCQRRVDVLNGFEPGDYELRFYVVRESRAAEGAPEVYFVGSGRLTVVNVPAPAVEMN